MPNDNSNRGKRRSSFSWAWGAFSATIATPTAQLNNREGKYMYMDKLYATSKPVGGETGWGRQKEMRQGSLATGVAFILLPLSCARFCPLTIALGQGQQETRALQLTFPWNPLILLAPFWCRCPWLWQRFVYLMPATKRERAGVSLEVAAGKRHIK